MTRRSSALSSRKSWLTDDLRISVPAVLGSSRPYPNPAAGQSSWATVGTVEYRGKKHALRIVVSVRGGEAATGLC